MLKKILGLLLVATSANATRLNTSAEGHGVCPDPTHTPPPLTQKGKDAWSSYSGYDYWHKGDVCKVPRKDYASVDDIMAMVIDMGHNAFTTNEDWIYIKDIKYFPNNKLGNKLTACPTCHLWY